MPQTYRLNTRYIYSFSVLEAKSLKSINSEPKSKCWQGHTPPGYSRGESGPCFFQFVVAAGTPWLVATSLRALPVRSHCPHDFCLGQICWSLSYKDTCDDISAHPDKPK